MDSQAVPGNQKNQKTRVLLVTRLFLVTQVQKLCLEFTVLRNQSKNSFFFKLCYLHVVLFDLKCTSCNVCHTCRYKTVSTELIVVGVN